METRRTADLRVLVVEDDETMRPLVCEMLRRMGFGFIESTGRGDAAIEKVNSSAPFDFVLCDWTIPNVAGIDVLKHVRAKTPRTVFVMTTGRTDLDSVKQAK